MIAIEPALIVTFITEPTHAMRLIRHLARLGRDGGLGLQQVEDVWYNQEEETIAQSVSHPDLLDVEMVQVAINVKEEAVKGWLTATRRLEEALLGLPVATKEAILGRTLIYQAATAPTPNPSPNTRGGKQASASSSLPSPSIGGGAGGGGASSALDDLVDDLLGDLYLQSSAGEKRLIMHPLAESNAPGGRVWLLQSAISSPDTIYIALEAKANDQDQDHDQQESLIYDVLFGQDALLLWTDTVAHKAYYMMRQYDAGGGHKTFSAANDRLMTQVHTILATSQARSSTLAINPSVPLATRDQNNHDLLAKMQEDALKLDHLSHQLSNITAASAELNRLHSRLTIHLHNYNISLRPWEALATHGEQSKIRRTVTTYHQEQLSNALTRIQEDINESHAALQAANTAFNRLRTKYEGEQTIIAEQERRERQIQAKKDTELQELTQNILAIVGVALAVAQIVTTFKIEWYSQIGAILASALIAYCVLRLARTYRNGG